VASCSGKPQIDSRVARSSGDIDAIVKVLTSVGQTAAAVKQEKEARARCDMRSPDALMPKVEALNLI
jgi:hypothetical protein